MTYRERFLKGNGCLSSSDQLSCANQTYRQHKSRKCTVSSETGGGVLANKCVAAHKNTHQRIAPSFFFFFKSRALNRLENLWSESLFTSFPDYTISFWFSVHPATQSVRKQKEWKDIRVRWIFISIWSRALVLLKGTVVQEAGDVYKTTGLIGGG